MADNYVTRENFIESLSLPEGVEALKFNGMNRVHFKYNEKGFLVIDMKASTYNLASRPEFFRAIGITKHDVTYNLGLNRAIIWDIPYSDTTVLFKLINYIVGNLSEEAVIDNGHDFGDNEALSDTNDNSEIISDINAPKVPKNRFYGSNGELHLICGNCGTEFLQAPRCPECGQLVDQESRAESRNTLVVGENLSGMKIYEIINKFFNKNYTGWMKASFDINDNLWAWFPKIYESNIKPNGNYGGTAMWSNTMSADRKTVISMNHDTGTGTFKLEKHTPRKNRSVLIFARINHRFEFLGVFDEKLVLENQIRTIRHDRIAKGIDLSTFELIDKD